MTVEENLTLELEPNSGWDSRIHIAKCGELVRAHLIESQGFLVVYDTLLGPQSGGWLRREADRLAQGRSILVVTSHADWDHYFGNQCFQDVVILGSQLCRERIQGAVGELELSKKRIEHPRSYSDVKLCAPNLAVGGETLLDGGDLTFHLLPTIGHRPDHLALYIPEIATLFPGDCVEDPIPLVDEDSTLTSNTLEELATSLELMMALDPQWVLANHAPPQRGTDRMRSNLCYLRELQKAALSSDSLEELRSQVLPKEDWSSFYHEAHHSQTRMAWEQRKTERA